MKLKKATELYCAYKRSTGLRFDQAQRQFRSFCRYAGDVELANIAPELVAGFLGMPSGSGATWQAKYLRLSRFFAYWQVRGEMKPVDMPARPARIRPAARAYIYSQDDVVRLLRATDQSQTFHCCLLDARTLRMLLILLYATGLTVGEATGLKLRDVDLKRRMLVVRNPKHGAIRTIPMGADLQSRLNDFLGSTGERRKPTDTLLSDLARRPLNRWQVVNTFSRLRRIAKVGPKNEKESQPTLRDFRTTFAIHRLRAWIKEGRSLNKLLPALASYMGHVDLGRLDRYLDLTPEYFSKQITILGVSDTTAQHRHDASRFPDGAC